MFMYCSCFCAYVFLFQSELFMLFDSLTTFTEMYCVISEYELILRTPLCGLFWDAHHSSV